MEFLRTFLGLDRPPKRPPPGKPRAALDMDTTLIDFGRGDRWRLRDAFEGTQIFGAIGSGKTSGSGQSIVEAFLRAGMGGLVLTAKPDECAEWKRFMKRAGRNPDDLIDFSPRSGHCFNFLDYERAHGGEGGGYASNLVSLFFAVAEADERGRDEGGDGAFWQRAAKQLLRDTIDLLLMADEDLSIENIGELIAAAPQVMPPEPDTYYKRCIDRAHAKAEHGSPSMVKDYRLLLRHWESDYPKLPPETRASVLATFSGIADSFTRSPLRELFGEGRSTVTPELTHDGKVIVVNLPVRNFHEVGKHAQTLLKYCWQRATEQRGDRGVPVFLWADEAQNFVNSHDMHFQSTARSSRAATVYLTQNISNYYAVLSGSKGKSETDSLLGNFQTKIFHANSDSVTNLWAAELIGRDWMTKTDVNFGGNRQESGERGKGPSSSSNYNMSRRQVNEFQVPPVRFTTLKKGGPENNLKVEAIVCQGGRVWSDKKNHAKVTFEQKPREASR